MADELDGMFWIGLVPTATDFVWAKDNTKATYTNWGTNEPKITSNVVSCLFHLLFFISKICSDTVISRAYIERVLGGKSYS